MQKQTFQHISATLFPLEIFTDTLTLEKSLEFLYQIIPIYCHVENICVVLAQEFGRKMSCRCNGMIKTCLLSPVSTLAIFTEFRFFPFFNLLGLYIGRREGGGKCRVSFQTVIFSLLGCVDSLWEKQRQPSHISISISIDYRGFFYSVRWEKTKNSKFIATWLDLGQAWRSQKETKLFLYGLDLYVPWGIFFRHF